MSSFRRRSLGSTDCGGSIAMSTATIEQPNITKKTGSRYNISVPLKRGRRLVFNSMTMAMAVWDAEDVVAYERIQRGEEIEYARFLDLMKGGFIVSEEIDEVEGLKGMYDKHRFDERHL